MATIQLGNTKVANKLLSYAEKRAEVMEGVNCPAEYAKAQFKATRELWGKNEGIQAHHVIQSFKPGEVTPEQANEIGQELAKEIAKGHEVVVYTHTDKEHIHNHIVINSVSFENGKKYQSSKKDLYNIREVSDRLCLERNLSVVKDKTAEIRYTQAEKALIEQGKHSWKDEIREKIDHEKKFSNSLEEFKQNMLEKHGIEVRERGKNITFINSEGKRVRGKKLGYAYEKESIKHEFEKQINGSQRRGNSYLPNEQARGSERAERVAEANERLERPNEKLHQNTYGQEFGTKDDIRPRDRQHQDYQQRSNERNDFDINEARKALERESRNVAKGFNKFTTRNEPKHKQSPAGNERDKQRNQRSFGKDNEQHEERVREHEQEKSREHKRNISKDIDHDLEL